MAGRIPSAFIDELINRVDIVEVIDSRVPLKKAGREYEACCPFHNEKTPSFKVNPQKQFYHCFGCKAGGSAITFLMEYDHLDFVEAVEELAKIAGVEVPRETGGSGFNPQQHQAQKQAKTNLYELMGQCDRFYRQQLRQHPKAQIAIDYLKGRGLTGEIAARYNLGYAPPGNHLEHALPGQTNNLVTTGMLIRKDNGETYDRFRHRVMFPIRDSRGRVIAFGGRLIPEEGQPADKGPKYLNSPETPLFHKGRELYGLYEVRQALRHIPRLLVVEGYMDVIALAQQGISYAVASLGTACTAEHIQKLFRLCDDVVFCFDGDRAGHEAAWRALENALPALQGTQQIRFLFLPDGEDPDSMVQKVGKQAFEEKIDQAQSLSQYFFGHLREGIGRHDLEAHRTLIEKAKPYLQGMSDAAYRALLVSELASYTNKDEREVYALLGIAAKSHARRQNSSFSGNNSHSDSAVTPSLVRTALRYLIHCPELAETIQEPKTLSQIDQPGIGLLVDLLENIKSNPTLNTAALLERWRNREEGKHLAKLATWQPPLNDPDFLQQEFLGAIERLQAKHLSARTDTLLAKANQGTLSPDEKSELQTLLSRNQAKDPAQN
ncbi:MAG: DNA primase [Thioalkalispiraceae bacterium]|jgi:DNA primase